MMKAGCLLLLTLVIGGTLGDHASDGDGHKDLDPETVPLTTTIKSSYDYIIIGGGSAGCVLASRLSENANNSVLLVEAGPDDRNKPELLSQFGGAASIGSPLDWNYRSVSDNRYVGLKDGQNVIPAGKVLGGSGSINAMIYCRGSRHDYDHWANYTGDQTWDYQHTLSYFIKAEGAQGDLKDSPYHGKSGPLTVERDPVLKLTELFVDATEEVGFQRNPDYNGATIMGAGYVQSNKLNGERMSASRAYLRPALTRPNLDVAVNTLATRVVIENGKAVGVELTRDQMISNPVSFTVQATSEVIVSAGTLETPKLLMLSGIGPRDNLEPLNIPVIKDLPVGHNFQDHTVFQTYFKMDQDLAFTVDDFIPQANDTQNVGNSTGSTNFGVGGGIFEAFASDYRLAGWPEVIVQLLAYPSGTQALKNLNYDPRTLEDLKGRDNVTYGFQVFSVVARPESRGRISLKSRSPLDDPSIVTNYLSNEADVEILLKGIRITQNITAAPAMKKIGVAPTEDFTYFPCKQYVYDTDEYWRCQIKTRPLTTYHYSGTCKMGPRDDPTAVLDPELKVKGIDSLRVVDASILPWITTCNTLAPTIMIAEKIADLIKGNNPLPPTDL